jgi:hypothetical protein
VFDEAGRFDEAFASYAAANDLLRKNWPPTAERSGTTLIEQILSSHPAIA